MNQLIAKVSRVPRIRQLMALRTDREWVSPPLNRITLGLSNRSIGFHHVTAAGCHTGESHMTVSPAKGPALRRIITAVTRQAPLAATPPDAGAVAGQSGDRGKHLVPRRETAGRLLREAQPPIHRDLEHAAPALAQPHIGSRRLRQDQVPRLTGARLVASHAAVFDLDLHGWVPLCYAHVGEAIGMAPLQVER